jgi:hypothetical protein
LRADCKTRLEDVTDKTGSPVSVGKVADGLERTTYDAVNGQYEGYQDYPELSCPR